MKKFIINGTNVYELSITKDKKIINRLLKADYIVIYDKSIIEHEEKLLLSKNGVTLLEHYRTIKKIYPASYVTKNFIEIGYKLLK